MHRSLAYLAVAIAGADAALVRRQDVNNFRGQPFHQDPLPVDPAPQPHPATAPADNSFSNGQPVLIGMPPETDPAPTSHNYQEYGQRNADIPFARLHLGQMSFFPAGQLNTPTGDTDVWTDKGATDSASQSACGIPDNAYYGSKVAIHPYFLKYAPLDRYCQPDICISFWPYPYGPGADMMLKVTDICSTDPNDPTHCPTPGDIKIDRSKAKVWSGKGDTLNELDPEIQGNVFPRKTQWYFVKCWGDGIVQPAYTNNWFAQPPIDNSVKWSGASTYDQWFQNQKSYPAKGWPLNDNAHLNMSTTPWSFVDWVPGQEPSYTPIAGGKGFGPAGSRSASNNTQSSPVSSPASLPASLPVSSPVSSPASLPVSSPVSASAASPSANSPALLKHYAQPESANVDVSQSSSSATSSTTTPGSSAASSSSPSAAAASPNAVPESQNDSHAAETPAGEGTTASNPVEEEEGDECEL